MAQAPNNHASQTDCYPTAGSRQTLTTLFISNLHCPSCVKVIESTIGALVPSPDSISISLISHSVTVKHSPSLTPRTIEEALDASGFEIHSIFHDDQDASSPSSRRYDSDWSQSLEDAVARWHQSWKHSRDGNRIANQSRIAQDSILTESTDMGKKLMHAAHCAECRAETSGIYDQGQHPLNRLQGPIIANDSKSFFSAEIEELKSQEDVITPVTDEKEKGTTLLIESVPETPLYQMELSIVGMTCSACVASITRALERHLWIRSTSVSLLTNSAIIICEGKQHTDEIVQSIEDIGFEASIESFEEVKPVQEKSYNEKTTEASDLWRADIAIGGMTCSACVGNVTNALQHISWIDTIDINLISNSGSIVFHGKGNVNAITSSIEDAGYEAALDKLEKIGGKNEVESVEQREVYIRIDAMYCHHCPPRIRNALEESYASDIEIVKEPTMDDPILKIKYVARPPDFTIRQILATVNSVDSRFINSIYHPPTIEDRSRAMHAKERRRIILRLALSITAAIPAFIIGVVCMNLMIKNSEIRMFMMHPMWAGSVSRSEWALFILATPIYFFAADTFHRRAIKEVRAMWRRGSPTPILQRFTRFGSMNMLMSLGTTIAYFSSVAELGIGATLQPMEGHMIVMPNESNYFDSVIFLTMFLLMGRFIEAYSKAKTGDAVTTLGKLRPTEAILVEEADVAGRKLAVDLLDRGDVILVPNGSSPPFDGTVVDGSARFDESSLTGESRPVSKDVGDPVYSGTVNLSGHISVRLTSVSGSSMLDQIIKVVREGQTRRAPVERAADSITSHFVPFVVLVGIITWVAWLSLGLSGVLPKTWVEGQLGGWSLWSLRFAIAVFVIACPCGIGLAAPTALFVGGGLAAKNGILVKGGGEAFQEASSLDCVVFDKTGTLTTGGEPTVTHYQQVSDDDENEVLGMAKRLEDNSGHPVARAIVSFCATRAHQAFIATDIQEIPGKGMSGIFRIDENSSDALNVEVIIGNEALMSDFDVNVDPNSWAALQLWKSQGNSVVLAAIRASDPFADPDEAHWTLTSIFAVSDALRPEAMSTVKALQDRGLAVWMLSGDNPTTAQAVGEMVGIPKENIIAGVLPNQKAEKIQWLQRTLPRRRRRARATVAMIGDGINDSPALATADVGIAIGSGSDVAISSAEFILISSKLTSILTLIDLSRLVFRRVWFNFGWALVYNIIAMPVAAGVFYPIVSNGTHIRLDPVWASLAMALSSVSVIFSSLLLRSRIPYVGFKAPKEKSY